MKLPLLILALTAAVLAVGYVVVLAHNLNRFMSQN